MAGETNASTVSRLSLSVRWGPAAAAGRWEGSPTRTAGLFSETPTGGSAPWGNPEPRGRNPI
eukprot:15431167-Alexandrium_andersonii.AAC.1